MGAMKARNIIEPLKSHRLFNNRTVAFTLRHNFGFFSLKTFTYVISFCSLRIGVFYRFSKPFCKIYKAAHSKWFY